MADKRVRIGFIGAGGNTRSRHIPGFKALDNIELVTVANRTPASSERVAKEFGISQIAADWKAVLADPQVDAVCIGTWPYTHAQMTIAALEAGKHVLCEARMAARSSEARDMLRVSREYPGLVAQIVPAPHTLGIDQSIRALIGGGYVGRLVTLDARISTGSFATPDSPLHWRQDRDMSGNNIMNMGIWYEALMRWVGPAASVSAVGQTVIAYRNDDSGARVPMTIPDHVDVIGALEQGGQMRFSVSSATGLAPRSEVWIHGTEGTIKVDEVDGEFRLWGGKRGASELTAIDIEPATRGEWRVEEEFVNAIRGQEDITHTDFATGVRYMEWTDAVTRSIRTGATVHLPLEVN
jgi:predicted dehydrogenase